MAPSVRARAPLTVVNLLILCKNAGSSEHAQGRSAVEQLFSRAHRTETFYAERRGTRVQPRPAKHARQCASLRSIQDNAVPGADIAGGTEENAWGPDGGRLRSALGGRLLARDVARARERGLSNQWQGIAGRKTWF